MRSLTERVAVVLVNAYTDEAQMYPDCLYSRGLECAVEICAPTDACRLEFSEVPDVVVMRVVAGKPSVAAELASELLHRVRLPLDDGPLSGAGTWERR